MEDRAGMSGPDAVMGVLFWSPLKMGNIANTACRYCLAAHGIAPVTLATEAAALNCISFVFIAKVMRPFCSAGVQRSASRGFGMWHWGIVWAVLAWRKSTCDRIACTDRPGL